MWDAVARPSVFPGAEHGIPVHVVATSLVATRAALAAAIGLAAATGSHVYVLARQSEQEVGNVERSPHALHPFAEAIRRLPEVVACSVGIDVLACLSRRPDDLIQLMPRGSIVFVGGPLRRWWPSPEQRLANRFARLGCRVTFVPASGDDAYRREERLAGAVAP